MENNKVIGTIAAWITILVWGTTFVVTKNLMISFNAAEILFVRFIIAWLLLVPGIKKEKIPSTASKKDGWIFFLIAITGLFLYGVMEILSMKYTYASNTSTIVSSAPFFTAMFTVIFFKEKKPSILYYIGFVVAMTGIGIISFNGSNEFGLNPLGDLLTLSSAIFWGFYTVLVLLAQKKGYSVKTLNRKTYFWGTIIMLVSLPFFGLNTDFARFLDIKVILSFAFLGIVASCLCFLTWTYATKALGAIQSSVYIYFIPVITIIFATIFLKEKMNNLSFVGIALVIAGTVLSSIKKKPKK